MKKVLDFPASVPAFEESLEHYAREGAQQLLMQAMELEVKEFLGRERYERSETFKGYRNGYGKARTVAIGMGAVEVKPPRISDVPAGQEEFDSKILAAYQRTSLSTKRLLTQLYLEGLSSGDFEPVFRAMLGANAPLSASSIVRFKEEWQQDYEAWTNRRLAKAYAYLWVDGVYLKAGLEKEKTALLVVIGVNRDGEKELLAIHEGYRESAESWGEVLRDLRHRGCTDVNLVIGDGHLGIWSALRDVFPRAKEQRCWNHKAMNIVDKLPKRLQPQVKLELRDIWNALTETDCRKRADAYAKRLKALGQERAAETLLRDFDQFVTFYQFPKEHWVHLRTTNAIESVFSGVRLRTNVSKRMRKQKTALYLVFKLIQRLSQNWRPVNEQELVEEVLQGKVFENGVHVPEEKEVKLAA